MLKDYKRPGAILLRKLDVSSFISDVPPDVPWLTYPKIAAKGHLTLLSAQPKVGKTWVSLAIASALSNNQSVAGFSNGGNPHKVVYLDAENGEGVLHRRIHALQCNPRLLDVYDARGFSLNDTESIDSVLENYLGNSWEKPELVVFDSFTTLWRGNQNDENEITNVLNGVRNVLAKHSCAGILIHHDSRYGGAYRGSGAIAACCEVILQLSAGDSCYYERILTWGGCRIDETPDTHRFNLRQITGEKGSCVCQQCQSYSQS